MNEIRTVEDIRRSSWREDLEERQNYEHERRKRELTAERKQREAHKVREAETASANWYAAVDTRIRTHFKDWAWAAIDERIEQWWKVHSEPLKDGIGGALGATRERVRKEFKGAIEELVQEIGAKLAALEERFGSITPAALSPWVDSRVKAMLAHEQDEFRHAVERSLETKLVELEKRLKEVPGKLPVAKVWCPESVTYQAEFVCHDGALWQACKDSTQTPGVGSDFVCVARAGRDGHTPKICGTFNAHKVYTRLDIVEFDGNGYLARRDAPGVPGISGNGWQLISRSGRRGPAGERGLQGRKGERGPPGADAPTIVSWTLDRKNYRAVPTMSNGAQGAVLELRGLFEQFVEETSYAVAGS